MKKTLSLFIALALVLAMIPAFSATAEGEVTNVIWYSPDWFNTDEARLAEVVDYCNGILAPKGLSMELHLMESGEYSEKIKLLSAASEPCDIMWTGYLGLNAQTAYEEGMVLNLEAYKEEVPALIDLIKIYQNGYNTHPQEGLFAIPCLQIMCSAQCMLVRKDVVEEYDLYDEIEAVHDIFDLSDFFLYVKQNCIPEDMFILSRGDLPNTSRYDEETGEWLYHPNVQKYLIDLDTKQVMDDESRYQFELEYYEMKKMWNENGFIHPDALTIADPMSDVWAVNKSFSCLDTHKPGGEVDWYNRYGIECVQVTFEPDVLGTGSGTTLCVAYQSENPVAALKVMEEVFTNKDMYNTMIYGFEGKDYEWADESHIKQLEGCYQANGWAVGNQFLAYPLVGQDADIWDKTLAINQSAYRSPIMDFSFDKSAVEAELANLTAVRSEYDNILNWGMVDDVAAVLTERNEALKAAGEDIVIAAINEQLNAFVAAQD